MTSNIELAKMQSKLATRLAKRGKEINDGSALNACTARAMAEISIILSDMAMETLEGKDHG